MKALQALTELKESLLQFSTSKLFENFFSGQVL